ncbi:756_t:CDS:2, partial [Funneliformis geosporum]
MNKISKLTAEQQEIEQLKKQVAELSKFKHERKGGSKKKTLDQISTPAHISEFMRDLVQSEKKDQVAEIVIDIACGVDTNALMIGADLDEEALELCKINLPSAILFKHNSLECDTPCEIKEHIFYQGTSLAKIKEQKGEKVFVMNPPFSLAAAVLTLPGDLFAGQNTGTHTCLM